LEVDETRYIEELRSNPIRPARSDRPGFVRMQQAVSAGRVQADG
jgi:hypothetical protein